MDARINVADHQYNAAERAVSFVNERFERLYDARKIPEMPELPSLEGVILILPTHEDVIMGLIANLERQALHRHASRGALSLARKIRAVTGCRGAF
jgi:hypothetical protein